MDDFTFNSVASTPSVDLSISSATGTEVGTTAITVTATASTAVSGNQTVSVGVTGTGIDPGDYSLSNSTITIPNGQTTGSVTFTVKDDLLNEGNETATLTISNPSSGIVLGTKTTRNITITDDDNAGTSNYGLPVAGAYRVVRNVNTIEIYNSTPSLVASRLIGTEPIVINGTSGNDTLIIDFAGGLFTVPVTFNGGSQSSTPGDSLTLTGGSFATGTFAFTNANDGTISLPGNSLITYTGLEPIVSTGTTIDDLILTFNGGSETIDLTDAPGAAMKIDSTLGESLTFANPAGSLTINAGSGNDIVNITSVDGAFNRALTINGDAGNDTINLNADVTFAAGQSLDVDLTNDAAGGDMDAILVGSGANLILAGTGAATLKASKNIAMVPGSSITTVSGNITLLANPSGTTSGTFAGIDLDDADITSTSGSISLTGTGGSTGSGNHGVHAVNTSSVSSGAGAAALTIFGTGGAGTGSDGVQWYSSSITTVDAAISIVGLTAGDDGMDLVGSAVSSSGDNATITIIGGTTGGGADADGVHAGTSTVSTSGVSSTIEINGDSRGGDGVEIASTTVTSTNTSGNIMIIGNTAGGGNGPGSKGVLLTGSTTQIASAFGPIFIKGTTFGDGVAGDGVEIAAGITLAINATGATTLEIIGSGDSDEAGVQIDSPISSGTGFVTIQSLDGDSTTDDIQFGAAGDITSAGGMITIDAAPGAAADVFMADGAVVSAGSGDVYIVADVDVWLGTVTTSGNVDVGAYAGAIIDNTVAEDANITGDLANLVAANGIGSGGGDADIETNITAPADEDTAPEGSVYINGAIVTAGGNITVNADHDIIADYDPGAGLYGFVSNGDGPGDITFRADANNSGQNTPANHTFDGTIQFAAGADIIAGSGNITFSLADCDGEVLSDVLSAVDITKAGAGQLQIGLGATFTNSGQTLVTEGILSVIGSLQSAGGVLVDGITPILAGTGNITGDVTIQRGANIQPGTFSTTDCTLATTGTLTVDGSVTANANITIEGGRLVSTGGQTYNGTVTVGGETVLDGLFVTFNDSVSSATDDNLKVITDSDPVIAWPIDLGAGNLFLFVTGNVSETAPGTITAGGLALMVSGTTALGLDNDVDTIAADSGGAVFFHDIDDLTVGSVTVDSMTIDGILGTDVELCTASGDIDIAVALTATGTVRLQTDSGNVTQSAMITAANLGVRASGQIDLDSVTNEVTGVFAAATASAGSIGFLDADGFTVGEVTDGSCFIKTTGVTANTTGNVRLATVNAGADITINEDVTSGTGHITITADDDVLQNADVTTSTPGTIFMTAANGTVDGVGSDGIVMASGTTTTATGSTVRLLAAGESDILLSQIAATNVSLIAERDILDNLAAETSNVSAATLRMVADSDGGLAGLIGTAADGIETDITTLAAISSLTPTTM